MERNSEGKLVDSNGVSVFKNPVFDQLTSREHISEIAPSNKWIDGQYQVYSSNPEDTRVFVDYNMSKLVDDNASLAGDEASKKQYLDDVICLAGIQKKILTTGDDNLKNQVLGGLFATKNDGSQDSMVPLYLLNELVRAKFKDHNIPVQSLDNFDVKNTDDSLKTSTLWNELDSLILGLKELSFDKKDYFGDMDEASSNYLAACQVDPNGSVDVYFKCEEDECVLYVTQGDTENKIPAFKVVKNNEVKEESFVMSGDSIPSFDVTNNKEEIKPLDNVDISFANKQQVDNLSKVNPKLVSVKQVYVEKKSTAREKYNQLLELKKQLAEAEKAYEVAREEELKATDDLTSILTQAIGYNSIDDLKEEQTISSNAALFK